MVCVREKLAPTIQGDGTCQGGRIVPPVLVYVDDCEGLVTYAKSHERPREDLWMLAVVLITAVAALVRFYHLGAESLWLDEATSLFLARMDLREMVGWTAVDIHPPFYYSLLHYWLALGSSEGAIRALSALAGTLTVPFVYGIGRSLFDRATGLGAALLLALSPFHLWYSQETRMYALVALLTTCSVYCMLELLRGKGWPAWVGYVLTAALSLYTHYYALFIVLFQNLFMAYLCLTDPRWRRTLGGWIVAQAAVLLCFVPWLPVLVRQVSQGGGGWVARALGMPSVDVLAHTAMIYTVGMARRWYPSLARRGTYLLFGVCGASAFLGMRKREPSRTRLTAVQAILFVVAYLTVPLGTAWVLSQWKPMYAMRYLLPFLPAFLLLVVRGATTVPWLWVRWGLVVLLALTQAVGVFINVREAQNPDWRGTAAYVVERAEPGDVVMFSPGWNVKPFDYYAQGAVDVYGDAPVPLPEEGLATVLAEPLAGHRRLWLIHEPGHYTDPEGRLEQELDALYSRLDVREYHGVGRVVLYQIVR